MRRNTFCIVIFSIVHFLAVSILLLGCSSSIKFSEQRSGQNTPPAGERILQEGVVPGPGEKKDNPESETGDTRNRDGQPEESEGHSGKARPAQRDIKVKALYLTGWTVGNDAKVDHFINLAKTTEINSYVIDIKDDDGYVGYETSIFSVRKIGGWKKKYNADRVLKAFHDNGIHVIGRLVCFKDPVLSSKRPDLAVKNAGGGLWRDNHKLSWLDPYNRDSWTYIVEIAREAVNKGFDEIQFDYVRFPNDGNKKSMVFGNPGQKKHEAINEFLAYARKELPGVVLSADVFGIICESPADTENIGQHLELIGKDMDYISPMVYPSHYAAGQIVNGVKFEKPDLEPYDVVYNSLVKARDRISRAEDFKAKVRPYLQYFTAPWLGKGCYKAYGPEEAKLQIKAVYDAQYDEWILWNPGNKYDEKAFKKEST
jgi:hypothetical protein